MVYLSDLVVETEKSGRKVHFPLSFTIKVDWDMHREMELIALYEKKAPSTWARDVLVEKIRTYQRNPQYLRFKKQLGAKAWFDKHGGERAK